MFHNRKEKIPPDMGKHTILVVDDIIHNRILLTSIIKKNGFTSFEAENGKIALDIINSKPIDLVFMDIEMPIMDGLETTQYIRNHLQYPKNNIPIIAVTAHYSETALERFTNTGFSEILVKPYNAKEIELLLHYYLVPARKLHIFQVFDKKASKTRLSKS